MGYCYDENGKLVCDYCGNTGGGVRKRACPFGYCPPPALCTEDYANHFKDGRVEAHRKAGCEDNHNRFVANEAEGQRLQDEDQYIRCSALNVGDERVHVLFKCHQATIGYYMTTATYRALPLVANITPEMYQEHGDVEPAPPVFEHSGMAYKQGGR